MKQLLLFSLLLFVLYTPPASSFQVHHDMRISLDPSSSRLHGVDILTIRPVPAKDPTLHLNRRAFDVRVQVDGQTVPFDFTDDSLRPHIPDEPRKETVDVTVNYSIVFDDPAPVMPVNMDNPGYGVSGTISERGTLLLGGAGWYPQIEADRTSYRLEVEAPEGTIAVTAGRSLGRTTSGGKSVSSWEIDYPVRGLSLSAARYTVHERALGELTAATYLLPENVTLADPYLDAIERYLRFYGDLFGPYPFEKFAVVENFFPTGFGFSSYTLLGGRILRLPFIIDTSLGHEIAHCWWGNGVYVDYTDGNWSEGLTTYVADYLILIGYGPSTVSLMSDVDRRQKIDFSRKRFVLGDQVFDSPSDAFFGVFDHPYSHGRTVALFLPLTARHAETVARKITHYGKYSYLSFRGHRNWTKGVWTTETSPLIHRFDPRELNP